MVAVFNELMWSTMFCDLDHKELAEPFAYSCCVLVQSYQYITTIQDDHGYDVECD